MWLPSCSSSRNVSAELGHLHPGEVQVLGRASHSNHSWQGPELLLFLSSAGLSLSTRWCIYAAAASGAVAASPLQFSHRNTDVKMNLEPSSWRSERGEVSLSIAGLFLETLLDAAGCGGFT